MNFVAVLFLACIAIDSGFSSDPALNTSSLSGSIPASEELKTCPTNSSISVKVLRSLQGEWLTTFVARSKLRNISRSLDFNVQKDVMECNGFKYISISGFLMDKDADISSEVLVGEHRNISGGEDSNSGKGSIDCQTNADISDRIENIESKLVSMEDTMNKLMLAMENMTRFWFISSEAISDRIENFESKFISIEETINKVIFTKENVTRNGKIQEPSNFAFDATFRGKNIAISADQRTAWRLRPHEELYYAGVVSNLPLKDDVVFEIRIDETKDIWREYGTPLGVIVKTEEGLKEMAYIYYNVPGTYTIRSYSDAAKGKSHIYKDGKIISANAYNMDTRNLTVGTTIGFLRRSNGALHFLLNGINMGVAFNYVPNCIYAFVDAIDYVTKISIIS